LRAHNDSEMGLTHGGSLDAFRRKTVSSKCIGDEASEILNEDGGNP
jgi:hypothetical protein